ncbi:hypothetical protein QFC21_006019 [Naganishia friedmannii]|uniref:Uncharacterized protein n=1 Tax=Naganishia friedmannii TaxID=89922 RepID=A0ACC2V566_9TREE|nr:hypothetical protein QFC21_006019 [Naganishia friedmannii]
MSAAMALESVSLRCHVKPAQLLLQPSAQDAVRQATAPEYCHQPPHSTATRSPGVSTVGDSFGSLILATPVTSCFPPSLKSADYVESFQTPGTHSEAEHEEDPFERNFARFLDSSPKSSRPSKPHYLIQNAPKTSLIPLPELESMTAASDHPTCDCQYKRKPLKRNRSIVLPDFEDAEVPTPTESLMTSSIDGHSNTGSISTGLQITVEEEILSASDDEMAIGYLRRVEKHVNLRSLWFHLADIPSAKEESFPLGAHAEGRHAPIIGKVARTRYQR